MPRRIETLFLQGPAGRLEAILEAPEDGEPRETALVCHPHPQHGGTMHNKVVHRIARGLRHAGAAVLRFNYRGVNMSEGEYAHGEGEREDAHAALDYLRTRFPNLPFTLAGFSFGSRIVLRLACSGIGARRAIAVGLPTNWDHSYLEGCAVPKIFIQSTHDQFGPAEDLQRLVDRLPEPKRLVFVEAADHFFLGGLDQLEAAVGQA
ncbi:MAG: alpha/beta hydrolase [Bryobacterales bacterium]|nr:alpha/beta hydrolase [Bryobacterales bacterium]MBV9396784.1 alpha/beta hydrolase [Bryobacterales bacterium]